MLQPVYVFIIFVLKRNVINVVLGRDKKRPTKSGRTNLSKPKKKPIIKNQATTGYQEQKDHVATFTSNPAFSISDTRDTESVILLSVNARDSAVKLEQLGNINQEKNVQGSDFNL